MFLIYLTMLPQNPLIENAFFFFTLHNFCVYDDFNFPVI